MSPFLARNRWSTTTLPPLAARTRATEIRFEWACNVTDQASPDRLTVAGLRTRMNGGEGARAPQRPRHTCHWSCAVPRLTWKVYKPRFVILNGPILAGPEAMRKVARGPVRPARRPTTRAIPPRVVLNRTVTRKPPAA